MNGTIISGEECPSRGNGKYTDPEEKHICLSQARNQYAYSTLNNGEMIGEKFMLGFVDHCKDFTLSELESHWRVVSRDGSASLPGG